MQVACQANASMIRALVSFQPFRSENRASFLHDFSSVSELGSRKSVRAIGPFFSRI